MKSTLALLTIAVALFVAGCSDTTSPSSSTSDSKDNSSQAAPAKELSPKAKVKAALNNIDGAVEDPVIKKVEFGDDVTVYAKTPEGGVQGASTGDLNRQAGEMFQAIYGPGEWKKTGATIVFKGGLVDSSTGKDLPNVNTGIFSMTKGQAKKINWADDDTIDYTIDWTNYRDFAHPALKQDD